MTWLLWDSFASATMIHDYWLILNKNSKIELKIRVMSFEREDWGGVPLHLVSFVMVGLINGLLFLKEDSENDLKIQELSFNFVKNTLHFCKCSKEVCNVSIIFFFITSVTDIVYSEIIKYVINQPLSDFFLLC